MNDPTPVPLEYEPPLSEMPAGPRPKWVYAIVAIYLLLLGGLLTLPAWASWLFDINVIFLAVCVSVLVISGLTLVIVPVRTLRRRPITRRSVWIPIIASGLLIAGLLIGGGMAFEEFRNENGDIATQLAIAAGIVWIFWSGIFIWITFRIDPAGIGMNLHRFLIAGSVLELLVAVQCTSSCVAAPTVALESSPGWASASAS